MYSLLVAAIFTIEPNLQVIFQYSFKFIHYCMVAIIAGLFQKYMYIKKDIDQNIKY